MNDLLQQLELWYASQNDGEWEHQYGVKIDTIDNPGWTMSVDLRGTALENTAFNPVSIDREETDWIRCTVNEHVFTGYGGTKNLSEIVQIFLKFSSLAG